MFLLKSPPVGTEPALWQYDNFIDYNEQLRFRDVGVSPDSLINPVTGRPPVCFYY